MKYSSFVVLSTMFVQTSAVFPVYDSYIPSPVCARFDTIKFQGDFTFVDTDNSNIFQGTTFGTTGDLAIGQEYAAIQGTGVQFPTFYVFPSVSYKSVCALTQNTDVSPQIAPTCLYEFEFAHCRLWYWFKNLDLDSLKIEKVSRSDVFSEQEIKAAALENDAADFEASEGGNIRRRLQQDFVPENVFDTDEIAGAAFEDDEMVDAILITREVARLAPAVFRKLCPKFGCYFPIAHDCRKGGFTGHGSGPDPIEITGGTNGYFGAFGQIITPTPFDVGSPPGTGASIDMDIEICFYKKETGIF